MSAMTPADRTRIADLFREPRMFDSVDRLERAGFDVIKGDKGDRAGDILVFRHRREPSVLFKKYANSVLSGDQLDNYRERIRGADALRRFIDDRRLRHVVVPDKHLHELPPRFAFKKRPSHMLVCERMDILSSEESKDRYRDYLDEDVLADLCAVVVRFRGLDSGARNMPFTTSGQIAFIDTENWRGHEDRQPFEKIGKYLSKRSLKRAKRFLKQQTPDN